MTEVRGSLRFEIQDPIGPQVERLLDAVLDDHDGAALVGERSQQRQQALGRRRIEIRERLVDHEQARAQHQDPGHGEQLSLAARQRARLATEQPVDAGLVGDLADPFADLLARDAEVLRPERQLRLDRRPDDLLGRVLQHRADRPGQIAQAQLPRVLPSTRIEPLSSPE